MRKKIKWLIHLNEISYNIWLLILQRNVLVESARIARGNIKPIEKLNAANFDALIIPGGK